LKTGLRRHGSDGEGFDTALKPHTAGPGGVLTLTELLKGERPGGPCEGGVKESFAIAHGFRRGLCMKIAIPFFQMGLGRHPLLINDVNDLAVVMVSVRRQRRVLAPLPASNAS
jgi:hypothetical protein